MGSLSRIDLSAAKSMFGTDVLVETGTCQGAGVRHALKHCISTVHSIEIDPSLYLKNKLNFAGDPSVHMHYGSSHELVPSLLPHIANADQPIVFWLDAHFPYADSGQKGYGFEQDESRRMPILSEIQSIVSCRTLWQDLIIVDDLRCFVDDQRIEADSFDEHMRKLGARGAGCTRKSIVGVEISDIINVLAPYYNASFAMCDEGYAVFSPKSVNVDIKGLFVSN